MNISLPKELVEFLDQLVKAGLYECPDLAVHDALWLLKDKYDLYKVRVEELRGLIAVGLAQAERGESAPLDFEALKSKALERLARKKDQEGGECSGSSALIEQNST